MTPWQLYERGTATLVASWEEYARGAVGAWVLRVPGATVGIFTQEPERLVYNNALADLGLDAEARAAMVAAVEEEYVESGVDRYAVWVHEGDNELRADLESRKYVVTESTRAMGMALRDLDIPRPELDIAPAGWSE